MSDTRVVRLNVGGQIFETTTDTLLKTGSRFFAKLLAQVTECLTKDSSSSSSSLGNPPPPLLDSQGIPFIDHCPQLFERILKLLREGELRSDELLCRPSELQRFQKALEFYDLQWPSSSSSANDDLPQFGTTAAEPPICPECTQSGGSAVELLKELRHCSERPNSVVSISLTYISSASCWNIIVASSRLHNGRVCQPFVDFVEAFHTFHLLIEWMETHDAERLADIPFTNTRPASKEVLGTVSNHFMVFYRFLQVTPPK